MGGGEKSSSRIYQFLCRNKTRRRESCPGPAERSCPHCCREDARAAGSGILWKQKTIWGEEQQPVPAIHHPLPQTCLAPLKAMESTGATGSSAGSRRQPSRCASVIGFGD